MRYFSTFTGVGGISQRLLPPSETWCNRGKSGYYAEEANGSDEMNNERNIENKVNCKLCGEEIDDPFRTISGDFNGLNRSAFHFTDKHVKELRELPKHHVREWMRSYHVQREIKKAMGVMK